MANDPTRQVQNAFHPSGDPNKTPVNPLNPIFHNPTDAAAPLESFEQAGVVQSDKNHRETVQSPLINERVLIPAKPSFADLGSMQAAGEKTIVVEPCDGSGSERDGWDSGFAGNDDRYGIGAEYISQSFNPDAAFKSVKVTHEQIAAQRDEIEDMLPEDEPTDEDKKQSATEAAQQKFSVGEKVTFSPESGNDTTVIYTIDGGEMGEGDNAFWFWRLVEMPGSLFLGSSLKAVTASVA